MANKNQRNAEEHKVQKMVLREVLALEQVQALELEQVALELELEQEKVLALALGQEQVLALGQEQVLAFNYKEVPSWQAALSGVVIVLGVVFFTVECAIVKILDRRTPCGQC